MFVILGVIGGEPAADTALRLGPVELSLGASGAPAGLTAALTWSRRP